MIFIPIISDILNQRVVSGAIMILSRQITGGKLPETVISVIQ